MMKRSYSFEVGLVLLLASIFFFFIPEIINADALFPFMFSLASFILGIGFFFMGVNEK